MSIDPEKRQSLPSYPAAAPHKHHQQQLQQTPQAHPSATKPLASTPADSKDGFFGRFFAVFCCCGGDSSSHNTAYEDTGSVHVRRGGGSGAGTSSQIGASVSSGVGSQKSSAATAAAAAAAAATGGGLRRSSTNVRDSDKDSDEKPREDEDEDELTGELPAVKSHDIIIDKKGRGRQHQHVADNNNSRSGSHSSPHRRSSVARTPSTTSMTIDDELLAAARDASLTDRKSIENLNSTPSATEASPPYNAADGKSGHETAHADASSKGSSTPTAGSAAASYSLRDESPTPLTRTHTALSREEESILARGRVEVYHPLQHDQVTECGPATPTDPDAIPPTTLLAPILDELKDRKCLVLDLDETLVHSSFKYLPQADFVIPVEIEGQFHNVYVIKRPGVDDFLKRVGQMYEIVVFTASVSKYGDPLLDQLDIHHVVHHRLFRESCYNHQGNYVKDLSQLGRPLENIIILDNSPASYIFHPQHALPISSWFSDTHDNELLDIIPFLEDLASLDLHDVSLVLDVGIPKYTTMKSPHEAMTYTPI